MRFFIAAALFVASVATLLVGVAQRTIWAPPASVSLAVEVDSNANYLTIPNEVLASYSGTPTVEILGSKKAFIATGRQADIEAWLGNSERATLELNAKSTKLNVAAVAGSPKGFSPVGSDLWRTEVVDDGQAKLLANPEANAAVLIASDGFKEVPDSVKLTWPIVYDLTPSNILLGTGLALLIGAIVVNALALNDRKRKRGPRRKMYRAPKPPQYRFKVANSSVRSKGRRSSRGRLMALPAAFAIVGLISGCAADPTAPTPKVSVSSSETGEPELVVEAPPAVVTEIQLGKILSRVADVVESADSEKSSQILDERFSGPALEMRSAHYKLMSKSRKIAALPTIVGSPITFNLPAASDVWPRTVMAVTDEKGDSALPQLLVMQQASPRANYQVWYYMRLMPGAAIPAVPASELGAIPVDKNSLFLALKPTKLPAAYGDVVNNGARSLSAGLFDLSKDEFYKQVSQSQKDQVANLTTGKITFTHKLGESNVMSLSTSGAGALVAVYMSDIYQIKPRTAGSAVVVTGQEKLLLGSDGSVTGVRSLYGDMLLFYVPAVSEKSRIRLLGATQGLVSVRSL